MNWRYQKQVQKLCKETNPSTWSLTNLIGSLESDGMVKDLIYSAQYSFSLYFSVKNYKGNSLWSQAAIGIKDSHPFFFDTYIAASVSLGQEGNLWHTEVKNSKPTTH